MVILRSQVKCFSCQTIVNKIQTLERKPKQYECFSCYKVNKDSPWGIKHQLHEKLNLFCQRCKYKFNSMKTTCPYCSNGDLVVRSDVSIHDLI